jgi:hypothetical protein
MIMIITFIIVSTFIILIIIIIIIVVIVIIIIITVIIIVIITIFITVGIIIVITITTTTTTILLLITIIVSLTGGVILCGSSANSVGGSLVPGPVELVVGQLHKALQASLKPDALVRVAQLVRLVRPITAVQFNVAHLQPRLSLSVQEDTRFCGLIRIKDVVTKY